ncbi:hypothetical protein BREU_2142 [Bifidobacterium reuteri DSM 23975]|uniref:Uncharacterized protein n=1 Tax=Bifidobacterium reuteri DSM 23975 TaxID=1437610 RepID=A0A087CL06_9BIFI|nr:hypothetical protein BREU_2142 [Bifidobacterium reuteri DSM 23975]
MLPPTHTVINEYHYTCRLCETRLTRVSIPLTLLRLNGYLLPARRCNIQGFISPDTRMVCLRQASRPFY